MAAMALLEKESSSRINFIQLEILVLWPMHLAASACATVYHLLSLRGLSIGSRRPISGTGVLPLFMSGCAPNSMFASGLPIK